MKILLYRWGAYTEADIEQELLSEGVLLTSFFYLLKDKNDDPDFESRLHTYIENGIFDAVFSVNYFPVIAKCCHEKNVKYISWSYDCPLNVNNITDTLGHASNYVFMFDHIQAEGYRKLGYDNVYHLPLAVATKRYDNIVITDKERRKYTSDISFVGNMYSDMLYQYMSPMTEYQKGYIESLCSVQQLLYGCFILNDSISEKFIDGINDQYKLVAPDTDVVMTKEALVYAMSSNITRKERLTVLKLLANHHDVQYFSREKNDVLSMARHGGYCDYFNDMPKVFKCSKINLNMTLKVLQSGIPLRALDIMGCSGLLMSNFQPELAENFVPDKELVLYESLEDAYMKADYYLRNSSEAEKIAINGYEKVKRDYTYKQRFAEMFRKAGLI